jgi:hypothetical protein
MLLFLGLQGLQGTRHQLDQFRYNKQLKQPGAGNQKRDFRIYRTMPISDWQQYQPSENNVGVLLKGHGGSLGQAVSYFQRAQDVALVEFLFEGYSEKDLVDYNEMADGGEGKRSKDGKMGGKRERNDVFGSTQIFSIHLEKNKDVIVKNIKAARALQFKISQDKQEARPDKFEERKEETRPDKFEERKPEVSPDKFEESKTNFNEDDDDRGGGMQPVLESWEDWNEENSK